MSGKHLLTSIILDPDSGTRGKEMAQKLFLPPNQCFLTLVVKDQFAVILKISDPLLTIFW